VMQGLCRTMCEQPGGHHLVATGIAGTGGGQVAPKVAGVTRRWTPAGSVAGEGRYAGVRRRREAWGIRCLT